MKPRFLLEKWLVMLGTLPPGRAASSPVFLLLPEAPLPWSAEGAVLCTGPGCRPFVL